MLRRLLKIANKIDRLGLVKEADLLDNIIKKMAAMGEGSPAWLEMNNPGAAGEESDLEMNDDAELNYPEQITVKTRSSDPKGMSFPKTEDRQKLIAAAKDVFKILNGSIDQVQKSMMQANENVFELESQIRPIIRDLINNYSNDQDSKEDVKETIRSLLRLITEDREQKHGALPYSTEWAFFSEDGHSISEGLEYYFKTLEEYPERAMSTLPGVVRGLGDLMDFFDMGVQEINNAKDFTDELQSEGAYTKMDEILEIVEPTVTLVNDVYDMVTSAKAAADKKYEEFKSKADETSPEQAQFEESMFGLGKDTENISDEDVDKDDWMY